MKNKIKSKNEHLHVLRYLFGALTPVDIFIVPPTYFFYIFIITLPQSLRVFRGVQTEPFG